MTSARYTQAEIAQAVANVRPACVTMRYTFEDEGKARVFVARVALRLKAALLRDGAKVAAVVPREDVRELDRLAMASLATFRAPGVWDV